MRELFCDPCKFSIVDSRLTNFNREKRMLTLGSFLFAVLAASAAGFGVVCLLFYHIKKVPVDNERAAHIAQAIKLGAMTFLQEEYRVIVLAILPIVAALCYWGGLYSGLCFLAGAALSLLCGFMGMYAATEANVRTTLQAKEYGEQAAFRVAFFGGGVMGFSVATFGVLGLGALVYLFSNFKDFIFLLSSFGLGASLVAFFARVGGGIYTKSADVGADLVGKLEAGIPEDDPRNPAVIADNVGDCVGDTAGMGADIYESYVGSMVGSIALATASFPGAFEYLTLPVVLAICGLIGSFLGLFSNIILRAEPAAMLRNATYIAIVGFAGLAYGYMWYMNILRDHGELFWSVVLGCVAGIVVGLITEYYTGFSPMVD